MQRFKIVIWPVAIIVAGLACAQSGLAGPASTGPLGADSLATIVAGTASAAAAETAQINLLKSYQATTSATAATVSGTNTSLTPQVSAEGTSLVKQNDGSYLFTDQQGGYSFVVPSVWLAMRLTEQDFSNAQISLANSDPQIQRTLSLLQNKDPIVYRLVALDTSPSDLQTGSVPNLTVAWYRDDTNTIEQAIAQAKKSAQISSPPKKITYADMGTTSTHIPMGIVEASTTGKTTSSKVLTLYEKMIIFKLKIGSLDITMVTALQLKEKFVPGFDFMTDQIKMLP